MANDEKQEHMRKMGRVWLAWLIFFLFAEGYTIRKGGGAQVELAGVGAVFDSRGPGRAFRGAMNYRPRRSARRADVVLPAGVTPKRRLSLAAWPVRRLAHERD